MKYLAVLLAMLFAGSANAQGFTRVFLAGDSITAGIVVPPGPSYAEQLQNMLGSNYEVINVGCSGATIRDWHPNNTGAANEVCPQPGENLPTPLGYFVDLLPIGSEVQPNDTVVLMLGSNDSVGFLEPSIVTPLEFLFSLFWTIEALKNEGYSHVILMTPPERDLSETLSVERLEGYRRAIYLLCKAPKDIVHCGPDVFTLLDRDVHYEGADVHPNPKGHRKIAKALSRKILRLR